MIRNSDITITILFDNYPFQEGLKTLWGFSCYIETPQKTILFDTGSNGRVLLDNMKKLHLDVKKVDTLFLTHPHWDHIGGVDSVVDLNPNLDIIAPASLSKLYVRDLKSMVKSVTVVNEENVLVTDSIYTTGVMGSDVSEQALVIDSDKGLIVITGCAHSGIVEIAKRAQAMLDKKIVLLLGGFHLMHKNKAHIEQVIAELQEIDIAYLSPTHCTGDRAIERIQSVFTDRYIKGGLGRVITIGNL